jgi:hypothetical protein
MRHPRLQVDRVSVVPGLDTVGGVVHRATLSAIGHDTGGTNSTVETRGRPHPAAIRAEHSKMSANANFDAQRRKSPFRAPEARNLVRNDSERFDRAATVASSVKL